LRLKGEGKRGRRVEKKRKKLLGCNLPEERKGKKEKEKTPLSFLTSIRALRSWVSKEGKKR